MSILAGCRESTWLLTISVLMSFSATMAGWAGEMPPGIQCSSPPDRIEALRIEVAQQPEKAAAWNGYAWALLTSADPQFRNDRAAFMAAAQANSLTNSSNSAALDTLALAYACAGEFAKAYACENRAIQFIPPSGAADVLQRKAAFEARASWYKDRLDRNGIAAVPTSPATPPLTTGPAAIAALISSSSFICTIGVASTIHPVYAIGTSRIGAPERFQIGDQSPTHATYTNGDSGSLCTVFCTIPSDQTVEIVIEGAPFIQRSSCILTAHENLVRYPIHPKVSWNWDTLRQNASDRPFDVNFQVLSNGTVISSQSLSLTVRPADRCPLMMVLEQGKQTDTHRLFSCYVQENHPLTQTLLGSALRLKIVNNFDGYQDKDPQAVIQQVYAIWLAIRKLGVKYTDISTLDNSHTANALFFDQYVRPFEESVKNTQANCVDGSALFASVLKRVGLHTALIVLPGHCMLGFKSADDAATPWTPLETTMVGTPMKLREKTETLLNLESPEKVFFYSALAIAQQEISDETSQGHAVTYIDVDQSRSVGIIPLAP